MAAQPVHAPAGVAPEHAMFGIVMRVLVHAEATGGALSLFEEITPPRAGPPLHVHAAADEFFRVLEGRYLFRAGDATIEASEGDTLVVPRGTPHCFLTGC
jgi:mannose-6-phosphate isomerase-like protein (cupin superfamily)